MKNNNLNLTMIAGLAILAGQACAQTQISRDGRPERMASIHLQTGLNVQDAKFLQNLYFGNAMEIRAGRIAEYRAQGAWAKEYAQEIVADHLMFEAEIKQVAAKKDVMLHNDMPADMEAQLTELHTTPESNFDHSFRQMMLDSHAGASDLLKDEIRLGRDENVRDMAVKTLPTVELHYRLAMVKETQMGATAAKHGE